MGRAFDDISEFGEHELGEGDVAVEAVVGKVDGGEFFAGGEAGANLSGPQAAFGLIRDAFAAFVIAFGVALACVHMLALSVRRRCLITITIQPIVNMSR